jgi:GH24 family phage-related lysozyme (muramidase)
MTQLRKETVAQGILDYLESHERIDYFSNTTKPYELSTGQGERTIVYIEGMDDRFFFNSDIPNQFNDSRLILRLDGAIPEITHIWLATTEPGFHYTHKRLNPKGCARIPFGQFWSWRMGQHRGYQALENRWEKIAVFRDKNNDYIRTGDEIDVGIFLINQHHGGNSGKGDIGRYSAGCLVGRTINGHQQFMREISKDPRYIRNKRHVFDTIIIPGDRLLEFILEKQRNGGLSKRSGAKKKPFKLKASKLTWIKKGNLNERIEQSSELSVGQKKLYQPGKVLDILESQEHQDGQHLKIKLAWNQGTWFIFKEDWQLPNRPIVNNSQLDFGNLPAAGIKLIEKWEGCHLEAYPDPLSGGEPYTIGYGTTVYANGRKVQLGDRISNQKAKYELIENLKRVYYPALARIPYFEFMDDCQQGSLMSFAYNLGSGFFGGRNFNSISTCLRNKDWANIRLALVKYVNPGSNVEDGLRNRRHAEADLWHTFVEESADSRLLSRNR